MGPAERVADGGGAGQNRQVVKELEQ